MDFTELVDLAQERLGGAVVYANDEFFAPKENLLKPEKPVFIEGKYTDRGKWMDGWETRRKRVPGHDFCIVRLGVPGVVRGVVVDTAFFKGNFPEHCSVDVCSVFGTPSVEQLLSPETRWVEILGKSALRGDAINAFEAATRARATHLRLHVYPDGGVARLHVHGDALPAPRWLGRPGSASEVDLAAVENGGLVVACNDMFFGSRHNLIMPGRSVNMGDGWETKRSRRAGPDWVIVQLAAAGTIHRIEVDTNHFKGNFPESCAIEVCHAPGATVAELTSEAPGWREILARTKLEGHTRHFYEREVAEHPPATHAKLFIFPDGGVSRLRLWGLVSREGREHLGVVHLNAIGDDEASADLVACCGSTAWARGMVSRRPFRDLAHVVAVSDEVWRGVGEADWLEAFQAHPRIGESRAKAETSAQAHAWAAHEQGSVHQAEHATMDAIAEGNREYEAKFGHIYVVCATGKSGAEMLAILRERLNNDPKTEILRAADEQRKITTLRLEKLVLR